LVALHALEKVAKFGYRAMSQAPPLGRFGDQVQTQTQPYPIWLKTSCFGKMFSTPLCDPPTDAKSLSGFRSVYGRGHHLLPTYPAIKRYHWLKNRQKIHFQNQSSSWWQKRDSRVKKDFKTAPAGSFGISTPSPTW
jgi:hypothetical protein